MNKKNQDPLAKILRRRSKPALFLGNGVNRYSHGEDSSWEALLTEISKQQGLNLTKIELVEMSNAELYDILDLAKPKEDRSSLQKMFCDSMKEWIPDPHHERLMGWALRNSAPTITVNFDENLSKSVNADFFLTCGANEEPRFTDYYPWRSYFSDNEIEHPDKAFAVWHAHGMMRYPRSIRLGLSHYMGAVNRVIDWVYKDKNSLRKYIKGETKIWPGMHTWLHPFFFNDILILGFGFSKDETFFRWLFLERARLYKEFSIRNKKTWYIVRDRAVNDYRRGFFEKLGVDFITVKSHEAIYESEAWDR